MKHKTAFLFNTTTPEDVTRVADARLRGENLFQISKAL